MIKNGELVDFTAQLAQGLPEDLLRQARDFLRRERPDLARDAVEREAIASVRAWLASKVEVTAHDPAEQGKAAKLAKVVNGLRARFEVGQKLELVDGDLERNEWRPAYADALPSNEGEKSEPGPSVLRRGGGDVTPWLVFAAKRNGVMH